MEQNGENRAKKLNRSLKDPNNSKTTALKQISKLMEIPTFKIPETFEWNYCFDKTENSSIFVINNPQKEKLIIKSENEGNIQIEKKTRIKKILMENFEI